MKKTNEIAGFIERKHFMTEEDGFVGIFAANRSEWMITDLAINKIGYTCVPFYSYDYSGDLFEITKVKTMFMSLANLVTLVER